MNAALSSQTGDQEMNIRVHETAAIALCAMVSLSSGVSAQVPVKPHPAKAAPAAPLTKPLVAESFARLPVASVVPKKPPLVVTAVAPQSPLAGPGPKRSIIFVGGKPQGGGDAALNPQPIPPGHVGPGDPIR
jgi:hypothetical protein